MIAVDPVRDRDERQVRLTESEALANVRTVLELCASGQLRCSDKTYRPTAATMRTIDAYLVHGDFYAEECIAAVAWPLLVQAGGLAKLDGTRLQLVPKGRAALGNPPAETIRRVIELPTPPPPRSSLATACSGRCAARSATGTSPLHQTRNCASAKP